MMDTIFEDTPSEMAQVMGKNKVGHHSKAEVRAAFLKAPEILAALKAMGLSLPRFVLFEDASGQLVLGKEGEVTSEQYRKACELVGSDRLRTCYICLTENPPEH